MPEDDCLKPTNFLCDMEVLKCICGNEGRPVSEFRFQVGTQAGKDHVNGRCFVRPTFDHIQGFDCSPGTRRKEIAVEEESDSVPICACEVDEDFEKFDTTDPQWWKCSVASLPVELTGWLIVFLQFLVL